MLLKKFMPSAQSLLIFEVAARHLNFTAAAKELGSTQSAVSQQIRGLEQQLELQLFKRIYRGVVLTDTGEQLYEAVESGFGQMTSCLERLQKLVHDSALMLQLISRLQHFGCCLGYLDFVSCTLK